MLYGYLKSLTAAGQLSCSLALAAFVCVGCEPQQDTTAPVMTEDDHGHSHDDEHAHFETLPEAVAALKDLRDTVRDSFADNDLEAAHGPLHDVGHLLGEIEELAEASDLTDEQKATVETAVHQLFDSFTAVDKTMHGEEGSSWSDVSADVDAALESLSAVASDAPAEAAATEPEPAVDETAAGSEQ